MFPHRPASLWFGGTLLGAAAAQVLSAALWSEQGGTHIVWFPGAVLFAVLLDAPRARWPALMLAAFLGLLLTLCGLFRLPVFNTTLVILPPLLLAPLAAWVLLGVPARTPLLDDFAQLFAFAVVTVVALPAASALAIDALSRFTAFPGSILSDWLNVALAHALGYVIFVPVWVSARSPTALSRTRVTSFAVAMAGSTMLLGVAWYALGDRPGLLPLLCLAPAPILIAAILRAQMIGSSLMMFVIVVIAAHLSVAGHGPFVAATPQKTTLALQLWALAAALCALVVSVVVEQRRATQRALNRAREDMRDLAARLIATQEQERARLARDLHDDFNQRLAATSIGLSALRRRLPSPVAGDVMVLQDQVIELSEDLRLMSHQLHPGWLSHAGLHTALESLVAGTGRESDPRFELDVAPETVGLPGEIALCFYRVVQESLRNALQHAHASRVRINVGLSDGDAVLRVADDGKGFDPAAVRFHPSGIGLISMRERAKLLDGSFELRTAPGKGVDICIRIPLSQD